MFQLGEHGLFSINRSTFANQQTLGQVLLIKSFKHIFSWSDKTDQDILSELKEKKKKNNTNYVIRQTMTFVSHTHRTV